MVLFFIAGTPKPLSRSASPHVPNQQQIKQSSSTVPLKSVSLSSESSSSSSSSGRYVTVWNFQDFTITQILREINFGEFTSSENAFLQS